MSLTTGQQKVVKRIRENYNEYSDIYDDELVYNSFRELYPQYNLPKVKAPP